MFSIATGNLLSHEDTCTCKHTVCIHLGHQSLYEVHPYTMKLQRPGYEALWVMKAWVWGTVSYESLGMRHCKLWKLGYEPLCSYSMKAWVMRHCKLWKLWCEALWCYESLGMRHCEVMKAWVWGTVKLWKLMCEALWNNYESLGMRHCEVIKGWVWSTGRLGTRLWWKLIRFACITFRLSHCLMKENEPCLATN